MDFASPLTLVANDSEPEVGESYGMVSSALKSLMDSSWLST